MKNYKIIESRPGLTKDQVMQGMSFAAIQAGAVFPAKALAGKAVVKTFATKAFVAKTIISIGVVAATVMCYREYNNAGSSKKTISIVKDTVSQQQTPQENITEKPNTPTGEATVASYTKSPNKEQPTTSNNFENKMPLTNVPEIRSIQEIVPGTKKEEVLPVAETKTVKPVVAAKEPFKRSPNAKCVLWNTNSFCNTVNRPVLSLNMECDACDFNFISCNDLNQIPNLKGVWITVTEKGKGKFKLETAFKNITLERSSGEIVNPVAIGVGSSPSTEKEPKYSSNAFKTKKLVVTFKKEIDIFLFFENAKVGDKIVIDNFIQAEIFE